MKKFFYKTAYRIVSWLTDLSGGKSFLIKWKTALAVVVIGFSTTAFTGCKPTSTCYEPAVPTCYDPVTEESASPGSESPTDKPAEYGASSNLTD